MRRQELSAPIAVQVELTTQCTNNCPHCYNYHRESNDPGTTMSTEGLRTSLTRIGEAEVFSVTLTGGEPLTQPELVVEGIHLCARFGIACSINTNLTALDESTLLKMKRAGRFSILTSIASHDEDVHDELMGRVGAHRQTIRGVELLKRHGVSFAANMVVTQRNADHVYATGMFAHALGARSFSATKASPPLGCLDYSGIQPTHTQVRHSLDELLRINQATGMQVDILECYPMCFFGDVQRYARFARRKCTAGVSSATVGPDGTVRPCSHSSMTYGSLLEEDLPRIHSRMAVWRTGALLPKTCGTCEHLGDCSGGCRCEAEYAGDITGMDPLAKGPLAVVPKRDDALGRPAVSQMTRVSVPSSVRIRQENFGYVVWRDGSMAMVGSEAGLLLLKLQEGEMSVEEATSYSGCEPGKVEAVLVGLAVKGLARLV